MGADGGITAALLAGQMGGSMLSQMFSPEDQELSSFEGKGAIDPTSQMMNLDALLKTLMTTGMARVSKGIDLDQAVVQQPGVYGGGGLPMPIGLTGREPATRTPGLLRPPPFIKGGRNGDDWPINETIFPPRTPNTDINGNPTDWRPPDHNGPWAPVVPAGPRPVPAPGPSPGPSPNPGVPTPPPGSGIIPKPPAPGPAPGPAPMPGNPWDNFTPELWDNFMPEIGGDMQANGMQAAGIQSSDDFDGALGAVNLIMESLRPESTSAPSRGVRRRSTPRRR